MEVAALPRSAIMLLDKLVKEGPLTPYGLHEKSKLPMRTVTFALKQLREYSLCKRQHNLVDMRQPLYYANRQRIEELRIDLDRWRTERRIYFRVI
ncbi:MAG: MarR family transcriptional regulator [Candidatus Thorarchaeota archaeon]|nr:MarR family transcriptional regulator [Candidatus Thorarchaeota archaeon]